MKIQDLIMNQFNSLPKSGKPKENEFTVLAGIIIGDQVVALGIGTSVLNHCQLSDQGESVNDCHAEALCIRSFRAYLYHQMCYAISGQSSILEYNASRNTPFRLISGIKFQLYISQAPCGDASCLTLTHSSSHN